MKYKYNSCISHQMVRKVWKNTSQKLIYHSNNTSNSFIEKAPWVTNNVPSLQTGPSLKWRAKSRDPYLISRWSPGSHFDIVRDPRFTLIKSPQFFLKLHYSGFLISNFHYGLRFPADVGSCYDKRSTQKLLFIFEYWRRGFIGAWE